MRKGGEAGGKRMSEKRERGGGAESRKRDG